MVWRDPGKKNAVETAQLALRDLQDRHQAAGRHVADLAAIRERVAYTATTGDKAARRELDKATQDAMAARLELEDLDAAIEEARRRIAGAVAQQEHEIRCAAARRALELTDELRAAGTLSGEALVAFVARYQKVQQIAADLNRLGIGSPRADVVRVNAERAIATSLGPLGLAPLLQPSQRCDLSAVIEGYCQRAESQARAILDSADNEKAA
jgi:hypothetical protein